MKTTFIATVLLLSICITAHCQDTIKLFNQAPQAVIIVKLDDKSLIYSFPSEKDVVNLVPHEEVEQWYSSDLKIQDKACKTSQALCLKMNKDFNEKKINPTLKQPKRQLVSSISTQNNNATAGYHLEQAGIQISRGLNYKLIGAGLLFGTGIIASVVDNPVPVALIGGGAITVLSALTLVANYECAFHLRTAGQLNEGAVSLNLNPTGGSLTYHFKKKEPILKGWN